jgi:hypothetical protein
VVCAVVFGERVLVPFLPGGVSVSGEGAALSWRGAGVGFSVEVIWTAVRIVLCLYLIGLVILVGADLRCRDAEHRFTVYRSTPRVFSIESKVGYQYNF